MYAMKTIVLISCVKKKLPYAAPAKDLYVSSLFKGYMRVARRLAPDAIFILSAKHGLLSLDTIIEPYEKTLKKMRRPEIMEWSEKVLGQLRAVSNLQDDRYVFLAGQDYRGPLVPHLRNVEVPFDGIPLFEQLSRLKHV